MSTVFYTLDLEIPPDDAERLLAQAQGLRALGYSVRVLCSSGLKLYERARKAGVPVENIAFEKSLSPKTFWRLIRLLKKHQPISIITHGDQDAMLTYMGVRFCVGARCIRYKPRLIRLSSSITQSISAFHLNRFSDVILASSKALRDHLVSQSVQPEKVEVLYPWFDFDQFHCEAGLSLNTSLEQAMSSSSRRPVIVHAADFRLEKSHAFMLEVIKALMPEFPNLTYIAVGQGPLKDTVHGEVKRLGLQGHVMLSDAIDPLAALLARADVVVVPSSYEPLGRSHIMALGLGVPVVVSRVGGLPETVTDEQTGRVCSPPFDKGALDNWVEALATMFRDPERARYMAKQGARRVKEQFARQENLQRLVEHFQLPAIGYSESR